MDEQELQRNQLVGGDTNYKQTHETLNSSKSSRNQSLSLNDDESNPEQILRGLEKKISDLSKQGLNIEMLEDEDQASESLSKRSSILHQLNNINVFKCIDESTLIELEEAFDLFDLDKDGLITHGDLKKTFISLGDHVPDEDITSMLAEGSKPLDFENFVNMIGQKAIQMDPANIMVDALSKWDYEQTGLISKKRIEEDLMSKGDQFTEAEVEWALEEAPTVMKKGMTMIEYYNFCQLLCRMRKADV